MKGSRLLLVFALVAAMALSGLSAALAAPAPQLPPGDHRGMFGTVTAVATDSITLDTAQGPATVKVDRNSKLRLPGKDTTTLSDVKVGDRLAILASKQGTVLTALVVMVVPGEPQNQHKTGVITDIKGLTITITDKDGNTLTLDVPGDAAGLALGKLITGVVRHDPKTGKPVARELHEVGKVIERLTDNVRKAEKENGRRGKDEKEKNLERLRKLLDDNVTRELSILREVMERVPDQAKPHIKEAMEHSRKAREEALKGLGMKGAHMEVQGRITAVDTTAKTVTVQPRRGDALVLKVTADSRIHKDDNEHATLADLKVGDTVLAVKFNPDTKEIVRLVAKTPRSLEASGLISAVNVAQGTVTVLTEKRDPLVLTVNVSTQVLLDGAPAGIPGLLVGHILDKAEFTEGTLVATRLVVLSRAKAVGHVVTFAGTIDSFTTTQVVVSAQQVTTNAQTQFKGQAQVGASARVEAIVQADGSLLALEVNVSQRRGPPEGQRTQFTGIVESFTATQAMVSGKKVVINDQTEIKGTLQVGATVRVEGTLQPDGSVLARKIDVRIPEDQKAEVTGVIESFTATQIMVSGQKVIVNAQTEVKGTLQVGATAKVEGALQSDGSILATKVDVRPREEPKTEFSGAIESISPTQWVVSGKKVNIDTQTKIEVRGILQVGAIASVEGTLQADGSVLAKKIEVRPARPTPGPTPRGKSTPAPTTTPSPTATPTPAPTATPTTIPTATPTPRP